MSANDHRELLAGGKAAAAGLRFAAAGRSTGAQQKREFTCISDSYF
jgi:hypothetical protein